jgi:tetratricopeptide (TPR) repeat protein
VIVDWASALIKAAPLAGKLAATGVRGLVLPWRVAFTTRRQAKKQELGVLPYWRLRKYLSTGQALDAFGSGEPERYHDVGRQLVSLYKRPVSEHGDAERQIVEILIRSYTTALAPNANVEMYSGVTAQRIGSQQEARDATRYAGETTFEQNLEHIPPQRADEARELTNAWPAVIQFVHEFVRAPDRASALVSWHNSPPTWFQTRTSEAVAWFARLASDYGLSEIAFAAYDDAIDAGATPEAYWRTRQLLTTSHDVEELAGRLERYADDDAIAQAIVTASVVGGHTAAAAALREWEPQSVADEALKCSLLSQLVAPDDLMEAIAISEAGFTRHRSAACGTLHAQFLIMRGTPRTTALEFADLERALEAALKARDAIRNWDGPSGKAVELAIVASRLLGRVQQAWDLARAAPAGVATPGEAATEGVRREAATIAAQGKGAELARELAAESNPMTQHEVEAMIALFEGDNETALAELQSAIDCAAEPSDLERLSLQMALLGVRAPKLTQLATSRQEEIGLIADAHSGSEEAVAILRTRSRSNRMLARVLIGLSIERGDARGAAQAAEQSGENWSDPELALFAAEQYLELEDLDSAVKCAEAALRFASPAWENSGRAYNVVIQAQTIRGRWAPAARAAMDFLAKEPDNRSAAWVLTLCQYHLGQFEQAWNTYSDVGHRPAPRDEHEARVRIDLWNRFERDPRNIDTLTALLERFPESREVKAEVVKALLFLPLSDEEDPATVETIRDTIAPLLQELQDVFVPKTFDQENPLEVLNELVRDQPDTSEQDSRVETGRYPIGMAATIHRSSLTELLASRTQAPIFSGDSETFETEVAIALSVIGSGVVVDLTALYALSILGEPLADQLLGCFLQPEAARAQLVDSILGVDSLAKLSTLQVGRAPNGSAVPLTISNEEAATRHQRAQRIRAQFDKLTINDTVDIEHFPELIPQGAAVQFAWLAALDNAIEVGRALWCDDRITRRLAVEMGVHAFGTQALLEALRRNRTLPDDAAVAYQARLISGYFVGLPFRNDWLTQAATIDGWKPRGAASFIAHSAALGDAAPLLNFLMLGVRGNLDDPEALRNWIASASYWLVHVAPSKAAAQRNVEILLSNLLQESWLESSKLPFVLRGVRDGIGTTDVGDPLGDAMAKHYRLLAEQAGWVPAAQRIRDLVALADRDDRVIAIGVVLQVH